MMIELTPEVNRAFSAGDFGLLKPGALPQAADGYAPNGAVHRPLAAELLIDVQRHHGMNFPNCVFLLFGSLV